LEAVLLVLDQPAGVGVGVASGAETSKITAKQEAPLDLIVGEGLPKGGAYELAVGVTNLLAVVCLRGRAVSGLSKSLG
jgi:hypothetical protein